MSRLRGIENEVLIILNEIPATRENDMILYYEYCLKHAVEEYEMSRVFSDSDYRLSKNVAVFESISRARRKLQEKYEHLRASEYVENKRKEKEEEFRDYVKE